MAILPAQANPPDFRHFDLLPPEILTKILDYVHQGGQGVVDERIPAILAREAELEEGKRSEAVEGGERPRKRRREVKTLQEDLFSCRRVCKAFKEAVDKAYLKDAAFPTILRRLQERSEFFRGQEIQNYIHSPEFENSNLSKRIQTVFAFAERHLQAVNPRVPDKDLHFPRHTNRFGIEQLMDRADWLTVQRRRSYSEFLRVMRSDIGRNAIPQLQSFQKILLTPAVCSAAVQCHGMVLQHVPRHLRTEKMCLRAVRHVALSAIDIFPEVPEEMKTHEFFMKAAKTQGHILDRIPWLQRTPLLCAEAVKKAAGVLTEVPVDFLIQYPEIFNHAFEQNSAEALSALKWIITKLQTESLASVEAKEKNAIKIQRLLSHFTLRNCLIAVGKDGTVIQDIFEEICRRFPELYLLAVHQNWAALQYVPMEFRDEEMYLEAIRQNRNALKHFPQQIKNEEAFLIKAIRVNWKVFWGLAKHNKSFAVCWEAFLQNETVLRYIPEKHRARILAERDRILENAQVPMEIDNIPD